jgi:protein TonB
MRLPFFLLLSIAIHGAILALVNIAPDAAVLPPQLTVTIERISSLAHAPTHTAPATPASRPQQALRPTPTPAATATTATPAATPPRFDAGALNNPAPTYPALARRRGIEGMVLLEVEVDAQGLPAKIQIATSSQAEMLDQAAIDAVRNWHFIPAMRGGEPVAGVVRVPVRFRLLH